MDSYSSAKQLREYLQEPQKPFVLDAYLSERRIMVNKIPKRPSIGSLNTRRFPHPSKIIKMIPTFMHFRQCQQVSRCHKAHKKLQHKGETIKSSTLASTILVDDSSKCRHKGSPHCENQASLPTRTSATLKDGIFQEQEVSTDTNLRWRCEEDNKQLSPVSVLDEVSMSRKGTKPSALYQATSLQHFPQKDGHAGAPTSSNSMSRSIDEDSILSAFLLELLFSSLTENQSRPGFSELQAVNSPQFSQNLKTNRILQQSKQLLYDSIKEAIETYSRKNRRKMQIQEFLSMQELGKIMCEQICSWGKQYSCQQISFDVSAVVEDKDYVDQLSKQIAMEVGDYIMDETIEEVVNSCL